MPLVRWSEMSTANLFFLERLKTDRFVHISLLGKSMHPKLDLLQCIADLLTYSWERLVGVLSV